MKNQLNSNNLIIPEAWNKIIEQPDELLIELINRTIEIKHGYKEEPEKIKEFINNNLNSFKIHNDKNSNGINTNFQGSNINFTNKSPQSFLFIGKKYKVNSWKNMLIMLAELLSCLKPEEFKNVLSIKGKSRVYFNYKPENLRMPEKIENTDIYVETNLSAERIVTICYEMIVLLGYNKLDLLVETKAFSF